MARKTNYRFERRERERRKAEKRKRRQEEKAEKSRVRNSPDEEGVPEDEDAPGNPAGEDDGDADETAAETVEE